MRTVYYTASSLDGYIADAANSLEWLFQFPNPGTYEDFLATIGALAMGSTTYEWLLTHQVRLNSDQQQPWAYHVPAWVFSSRSLPVLPEADVRFVRGDVAPVHREMTAAAAGRDIWLVGGGDLVGQFHDAGLLDEIIVTIASVTLGSGAPLLPRRIVTPPLRLLSLRAFGDSFAELRYEVRRG